MRVAQILIPILGLLVLFPFVSPALGLILGIALALAFKNPYPTQKYTHKLLTWSVVGLGAGMNLGTVAEVGLQGLGYTLVSITLVMLLGKLLQTLFKVEDDVGLLITVGTAICGGSAIAAMTPVIRAKPSSVSVALGSVFILNALALVLFPFIGHSLHLSERAFGLWCALAIHDTSSVVGATVSYGPLAAQVGTTVKLTRALWIVPLVFVVGQFRKKDSEDAESKTKKSWFILGFLLAAAVVTWVPGAASWGLIVEKIARRTLVLTLFFIGLGLFRERLKQVGFRPFLLAVTLWILVGTLTLAAIEFSFLK